MTVKRVILDVDTGVDDAWAIMFALKSPEIEIEAITTVAGNVELELTTKNTLRILEMMKATYIPVGRGMDRPFLRELKTGKVAHGDDGLGNMGIAGPVIRESKTHAVDMLIKHIMNSPGQITLIPVGPLSNIAAAYLKEPRIAEAVKEVIIMGGAVMVPGNRTPAAEFNIYTDAEAAKIVFGSKMPMTLVGLDVTRKTLLRPEHLEYLRSLGTAEAEFVARSAQIYLDFSKKRFGINGCALHDPLTVGVAIDASLVETREMYVDVEITGEITRGKTLGDYYGTTGKEPNMKVCMDVDADRFVDLFVNRIANRSGVQGDHA
jgi:purine nucleosidase